MDEGEEEDKGEEREEEEEGSGEEEEEEEEALQAAPFHGNQQLLKPTHHPLFHPSLVLRDHNLTFLKIPNQSTFYSN